MTENQTRILELFKLCSCEEMECGACSNIDGQIIPCDKLHEAVLEIVEALMADNARLREAYNEMHERLLKFWKERDVAIVKSMALSNDLHLACDKNNPCLVCDYFRQDGPKPRCEFDGLKGFCKWTWRGARNNG